MVLSFYHPQSMFYVLYVFKLRNNNKSNRRRKYNQPKPNNNSNNIDIDESLKLKEKSLIWPLVSSTIYYSSVRIV